MARTKHPFLLALPLAASLGLPAQAQDSVAPMDGIAIEACTDAMVGPCVLPDGTLLEGGLQEGGVEPMVEGESGGALAEPMPVEPEYVEPEYVEPAPVDPEFVEPMPVEPEYVEPEYVEPAPVDPEFVEPMPVEPEYAEPEYVEPAPVDPEFVEPMPVEPEYAEPGYVEPAPVEPEFVEPMPVEPEYVEPGYVEPAPVEPEFVEPMPVEPEYVEPAPAEPMDVAPVDPLIEPLPVPEVPMDPVAVPEPMEPVLDGGSVAPAEGMDSNGDAGVSTEPMTTDPVDTPVEPMVEEPTTAPADLGVDGTVGGVDAGGDAGSIDPALVAPAGQAVEEVYVPDAPAAVEAQQEAAADPEVQASVEALEQSFTAPPEALENDGAVMGTVERRIDTVRSTDQEYRGGVMATGGDRDSARAQAARDRAERRDRLESAGLGFIAGLMVGAVINDRQEVVATTPERIVIIDRTTNVYQVWRDDDVLLRRPGTQETIRNYRDGSTRTVLAYNDGTTVETIRDATGRVVWRQRTEGARRVILINETRQVGTIDVRTLPAPRVRDIRIPNGIDPYFGAELVRSSATPVDRFFTLGQIRNVEQVRSLAPALATDPVLFASGSAALDPRQAGALSGLAGVMLAMLEDNPAEMFLVEGHTDAVGSAAFNLALSDRRAETVASALVEYFGVPPENLVFQGYGEALLKVRTAADEPRNRRVEIRRITPLLAQDN
jgi:outer membrane protein OmpA-like peptidoglycan-associated protein